MSKQLSGLSYGGRSLAARDYRAEADKRQAERTPQPEPIKVYRLTLESLNGRRLGDFALPRTLGYFQAERSAEAARAANISKRKGQRDEWTTSDDYLIEPVNVLP